MRFRQPLVQSTLRHAMEFIPQDERAVAALEAEFPADHNFHFLARFYHGMIQLLLQVEAAMDPVSLTLGILPPIGGGIGIYKTCAKKFKVFYHFSREVDRIRKQLNLQRQIFLNENRLILRLAIRDEETIEEMLCGRSKDWSNAEIETALQGCLKDNYDSCRDLFEEIATSIEDLQKELDCFNDLAAKRNKVSTLSCQCCLCRRRRCVARMDLHEGRLLTGTTERNSQGRGSSSPRCDEDRIRPARMREDTPEASRF